VFNCVQFILIDNKYLIEYTYIFLLIIFYIDERKARSGSFLIKKAVCLFVFRAAFLSHLEINTLDDGRMTFHREKTASEFERESSEKNFNPLMCAYLRIAQN